MIQDGVMKAVRRFLSTSLNAQLSSSNKTVASITKVVCNVVSAILQEFDRVVKDPSSPFFSDPLNEHLSGAHPGLARSFIALLSESIRSIEPPSQSSEAQLLVCRAALFSLHWSIAPLVMSETSRSLLLSSLSAAALSLPDHGNILPFTTASEAQFFLQGYLLTPKSGEWMSWREAMDDISGAWRSGRSVSFNPYNSGVLPSDSKTPYAGMYHCYQAYGSGQHIYLPSASSISLQYIFGLALRSGLHPILVGELGSGKKTLTDHLLSCWRVFGQFTAEIVKPSISRGSEPCQLHALLMTGGSIQSLGAEAASSISAASWAVKQSCFRPRAGHQLVILIQDLHVLSCSANHRGLEWLRRLLDDSSSTDSARQGSRIEVHGVSAALTSTPHHLVAGLNQASPRLLRHLHHLHIESNPASSLFTVMNKDHVLEAHCHAALMNIVSAGGVTTFTQHGQGGLDAAAKVLSSFIADAILCTSYLNQARVISSVSFNLQRVVSALSRIEADAASNFDKTKRPWTPTSIMLRLVYEIGREVGLSLPMDDALTFSRVWLRISGRELGAFIGSGKFHAAVRARDRSIDQKRKDVGVDLPSKSLHVHLGDDTWLDDWSYLQPPPPYQTPLTMRDVLQHWADLHPSHVTHVDAKKSIVAALVSTLLSESMYFF